MSPSCGHLHVKLRSLAVLPSPEPCLNCPKPSAPARRLESALGRRIVAVDDRRQATCAGRTPPGEIASGLIGHEGWPLAERRGKFLWAATDDGPDARPPSRHGRFGSSFDLSESSAVAMGPVHGRVRGRRPAGALRDKRRLRPAVLNSDFSHVGPDAAGVDRESSARGRAGLTPRSRPGCSTSAHLGRRQSARRPGLWRARIAPGRHALRASPFEVSLDRLRREVRARCARPSARGAPTRRFVAAPGRAGKPPARWPPFSSGATIGGRTTFWCPACQTLRPPLSTAAVRARSAIVQSIQRAQHHAQHLEVVALEDHPVPVAGGRACSANRSSSHLGARPRPGSPAPPRRGGAAARPAQTRAPPACRAGQSEAASR